MHSKYKLETVQFTVNRVKSKAQVIRRCGGIEASTCQQTQKALQELL